VSRSTLSLRLSLDPVSLLQACKGHDVYNGLQRRVGDGNRVLLCDVRPLLQWKRHRIRDAELIGLTKQGTLTALDSDGGFSPFVPKGQLIIVLVDEDTTTEEGGTKLQREVAKQLRAACMDLKVFLLDGGMELFQKTYPFLCVGQDVAEEEAKNAEKLWPAELIPGQLYLGTTANANDTRQMERLGIKFILNLDEAGLDHLLVECVHLPHAAESEYDPDVRIPVLEGLAAIEERAGKEQAVLISCMHGTSIGPAVAIAQIMATRRMPHLQAMAYVIKRKRDASPHAGAYSQLQELQTQLGLR